MRWPSSSMTPTAFLWTWSRTPCGKRAWCWTWKALRRICRRRGKPPASPGRAVRGRSSPKSTQELAEWPPTQFLGYDASEGESTILALIVESGHNAQAEAGEDVEVIAGASPVFGDPVARWGTPALSAATAGSSSGPRSCPMASHAPGDGGGR